jgi:hypothetical protein
MDGRYHFIPHDLIYTNRRVLAAGSLTEDRLRDLLAKMQAQKSLVVIDSCYTGAALGDKIQLAAITGETRTRGRSIEEKGAIDRLMAKTGRAVLASSTQWQFALEAADLCCCLFLPIF